MTITIGGAVSAFLAGVRGEIADATVTRYGSALGAFVAFVGNGTALGQLGPADVRAFRSHRLASVSPFTVNSDLRALRRLYGWLVREGLASANVPRGVPFVRTPKDVPKAVLPDDVARVVAQLAHESERDRAFTLLLIDTGCRVGGVTSLTLDRLSVDGRRAIVTEKGDRARAVYFTDTTADALSDWLRVRGLDPSPFVFLSKKGGPLTVSGARQLLERLGERAGVSGRCNPHAFRHAFARSFLENGGNLASLGRIMGHAPGSPVTAQYYAVWDDRELAAQHARYSPLASLNGNGHR